MKNHKYTRKWYKPKDRKVIRQKRREHKQKVRKKMRISIGEFGNNKARYYRNRARKTKGMDRR